MYVGPMKFRRSSVALSLIPIGLQKRIPLLELHPLLGNELACIQFRFGEASTRKLLNTKSIHRGTCTAPTQLQSGLCMIIGSFHQMIVFGEGHVSGTVYHSITILWYRHFEDVVFL